MKARMTMLAAVAVAAAALAAGCGGDEESGDAAQGGGADGTAAAQADGGGQPGGGDGAGAPVATSDLSKAEFVEEASAMCNEAAKDALGELDMSMERETKRGLPEERVLANSFKAVIAPISEARVDGIRELGAPQGDEEEVEAFLVATEEAVEKLRKSRRAKEIGSFAAYFNEANRMMTRYGLPLCRTK